jgi:uncharacterized protein (TIGR02270 family)
LPEQRSRAAHLRRGQVVPVILQQHFDEAAFIYASRTSLTGAPHAKLHHLSRFDNRLAGHLDGLVIAGAHAEPVSAVALESPSAGNVFVAATLAIGGKQTDGLERLLAMVEAVPEKQKELIGAFGWLERAQLQGIVANLLSSKVPFRQTTGIAACALHRVDPGLATARWMEHSDAVVRARALRTAGELGRRELVSTLARAINDPDASCQIWAAWAAVLLGDRQNALDFLKHAAFAEGPLQARAFQVVLLAAEIADGHLLLSRCADDPVQQRKLIQGSGFIGDPAYVPWLISLMADDSTARLAGEAFSFITGADLAELDLERDAPEDIAAGPNDDPDDEDVEMDADEDLPWPDPALVQAWWKQNASRFKTGVRHLAGSPVTAGQCWHVLGNGYQRQRIAAALHLCLLEPGTPLFEWRAAAWRQQQSLLKNSAA